MGYAAPESLQREDARILKEELGCVIVRTSHYPQSQYFVDECDRLGLLVFTEIPGWQHIGDEAWKDQAVENVREMVTQYRNHPSIILWGVRINESLVDDAFYLRTNALAHELDPSRATGGVRYLEKSSFLEDVYTFNDFSHKGDNPGVRPKKNVTPDMSKALLITEHNGHMFPT
jgi:beta-galactosidase